MRTLLVFFCLSSIIFFSKCETVQDPEEEETTVADTCRKEDDDENLTKENCFTRTAKSSELECCYLTYKIEKIEDSMCVSALKSKTKEIEDTFKTEMKKTTGLTVTPKLVCGSSILRFSSLLALIPLLLM